MVQITLVPSQYKIQFSSIFVVIFFVRNQMFWWWWYNWFWKLVAKDFENVIYQQHMLTLEFCFWDGNPELCNDVIGKWNCVVNGTIFSETAQPLLIKHTTFWRKKNWMSLNFDLFQFQLLKIILNAKMFRMQEFFKIWISLWNCARLVIIWFISVQSVKRQLSTYRVSTQGNH